MLFFFVQAVQDDLPGGQEQDEVDLISFFGPIPGAGKGAAEELLIDLDYGEPSTNIEADLMNLEGFRFQFHLNKEGYLETSLLDIDSPELNEPILQPGVRSMDMKNPEIDRIQDEISEVRDWIKRMHQIDQDLFGFQVISLDVEDVKVTYYDTLRMAGNHHAGECCD